MDIQEELNKIKRMPNKLSELDSGKFSNIDSNRNTNDTIFSSRSNENDFSNENLGRPSLPDEEKAKPIPIRLHQSHLEKLEYIPGSGYAEKVRFLIDTVSELRHRERKQFKAISDQIDLCYRLAVRIYRPAESGEDVTKRNKVINRFKEEFRGLEAMVNLFSFSYGDLKRGLDSSKASNIDIIFLVRDTLKAQEA